MRWYYKAVDTWDTTNWQTDSRLVAGYRFVIERVWLYHKQIIHQLGLPQSTTVSPISGHRAFQQHAGAPSQNHRHHVGPSRTL